MPVKVFLVESREIVKLGIKAMLNDERNILLIGDANDEIEALDKLSTLQPDVILMDMNVAVKAALEFTRKIKKEYPDIRVLILTTHDYESSLLRLLQGGVDGYILKNTSKDELVFAIEKVNNDGVYMKPEFNSDLPIKHKIKTELPDNLSTSLTDREMQVLSLIADGLTNIEMSKKLFTSVRTIETRRKKLLDKTGTVNTATLIRFAVLNGLVK